MCPQTPCRVPQQQLVPSFLRTMAAATCLHPHSGACSGSKASAIGDLTAAVYFSGATMRNFPNSYQNLPSTLQLRSDQPELTAPNKFTRSQNGLRDNPGARPGCPGRCRPTAAALAPFPFFPFIVTPLVVRISRTFFSISYRRALLLKITSIRFILKMKQTIGTSLSCICGSVLLQGNQNHLFKTTRISPSSSSYKVKNSGL